MEEEEEEEVLVLALALVLVLVLVLVLWRGKTEEVATTTELLSWRRRTSWRCGTAKVTRGACWAPCACRGA